MTTDGGSSPVWSRDGKSVFFRTAGALWRIPVQTTPVLQTGTPEHLFDADRFHVDAFGIASYDVSPDGQYFVFPYMERVGRDEWQLNFHWDLVLKDLFANSAD